jgi:hypothetical protein
MKHWAAVLGLLAILAFLPACSSSSSGMPPARPGPFASQADQVVADLAAGSFAAVEARFEPAMKARQAPNRLQNEWIALQMWTDSYRNHVAPAFTRAGQDVVEQVPVRMAHGHGEVRITFRPGGIIAGLPIGETPIVPGAGCTPALGTACPG